jgi:hypothetical protein
MMMLALSLGHYLKTHSILLSLAFAVVMILNDWQDSENTQKGDAWPWWLRIGLILLAAFTGGALVNELWPSFVIGLVALYVDARLLKRRIKDTANTIPDS